MVRTLRKLDESLKCKVTGDVAPKKIFENSDEDAAVINLIIADDVIFACSSDGGTMDDLDDEDDLKDLYLMHA